MKINSLFCLLFFSFLFNSCSVFKTDCASINWFEEGKKAESSSTNPSMVFSEKVSDCRKPPEANAEEEFNKGVLYQRPIKCTGFSRYYEEGWKGLGEYVAQTGEKEIFYLTYQNRCALSPSKEQIQDFKEGYGQGLKILCTKTGGVDFYRNNYTYKSTCPKNTEADFFFGRSVGIKMRENDQLREKISTNNEKIDELQKNSDKVEDDIRNCQDKISDLRMKKAVSSFVSDCYGNDPDALEKETREKRNILVKNKNSIRDLQKQNTTLEKDANRVYLELEMLKLTK